MLMMMLMMMMTRMMMMMMIENQTDNSMAACKDSMKREERNEGGESGRESGESGREMEISRGRERDRVKGGRERLREG